MEISEIDAIIFDLGGVILNLDYQRTIDAFSSVCGKPIGEQYSQAKQAPVFDAIETGEISPEEFREQVAVLFGLSSASASEIDSCWNAMLLDLPKERLSLLKELSAKKRLFLFSNTNAIHKASFDAAIKQQHGLKTLDGFFEKAYYSHILGMRKPNVKAFQYIIEENGLEASKTLFIDDSGQHIEGATKAGLQTYHLVPPQAIEQLNWLK
jgi:putative hydrolase of the HAD superfamily